MKRNGVIYSSCVLYPNLGFFFLKLEWQINVLFFPFQNTVENIAALLEIVRIYSYRDIPPTPDAVQTLVEMGFQESDVIEVRK